MLSDGKSSSVLGFTLSLANFGEIRSWGWVITLIWHDQVGDNFRYNGGLNLMCNQKRVVERLGAPKKEDFLNQTGYLFGSHSQFIFFEFYISVEIPSHSKEVFGTDMTDRLVNDLIAGAFVYVDLNIDVNIDSNDMSRQFGFTDETDYLIGLSMDFS